MYEAMPISDAAHIATTFVSEKRDGACKLIIRVYTRTPD